MRTVLLLALVALFLALVEVGGQEVRADEKKYSGPRSGQDWDYYEEEFASSGKRKRREAFGEERKSGEGANKEDSSPRLKRNPNKKSAIRINQEMSELNSKNNTEPLLVEDPPGIGLGHILGNAFFCF